MWVNGTRGIGILLALPTLLFNMRWRLLCIVCHNRILSSELVYLLSILPRFLLRLPALPYKQQLPNEF